MTPTVMDLRHVQRQVATALELALVAFAPRPLVESLATAAGLLGALRELPLDTEPLRVWAAEAIERAEAGLRAWSAWESERKASA